MSGHIQPSFQGIVLNSRDALLLFTEAINGHIPMITRRPHDKERAQCISSGNIFIYCEHNSSIKRWTDGVTWSPSRIMGNFLIYRELNKGFPPGEKKRAAKKKRMENDEVQDPTDETLPILMVSKDQERALIGSLIDSYDFKREGLVKKTISVKVHEQVYHLVSYYTMRHAVNGGLAQPSQLPQFSQTQLLDELITNQNFRVAVDVNGIDLAGTSHSPASSSTSPVLGPHRGYIQDPDDRYGQHPGYMTSPSTTFPSPTLLGRYDGQRDSQLSYETSTNTARSYSGYMSNGQTPRSEHDGIGIFSQLRDNVPRSQLPSYPLQAGAGDYTTYQDASARAYSIGGGLHAAPSLEGGGNTQGRSAPYGPAHYGMTDPSSYTTGGAPSMSALTRGFMTIHPMASSLASGEKPPSTPLISAYAPPPRSNPPDQVDESQRTFQPAVEEPVPFNSPNW